ncbi:MAG: D-alanine--D-alanine ligase [Anaerolineales bacterium]|nr:D-alanine--D-alanine ligase [Anaerolineales bacterium]
MNEQRKLKVAILFGGRSGEHEVSLNSARSVLSVLDPSKYEVIQIGITREGNWLTGENVLEALVSGQTAHLEPVFLPGEPGSSSLYFSHPISTGNKLETFSTIDVFFPVLHGTYGEDGTLQGLFEMADVAYVGAGVTGSAVGMDKGIFKDVMRANDIPVVEGIIALRSEIEADMDAVITKVEQLGEYPFFAKPANLGSSVGVSKCNRRSDLQEGLLEAAAYDRRVLIECGIRNAREIEISVLGNDNPKASVPGEVQPSREFYSYESKYVDGSSGLLIPAPVSTELSESIRQIAVKAYKAIDCAGMARVDFLLEGSSEKVYLNEVNTLPGFTQISMYPKLWENTGLPYPQLIDRLIELALERKTDRDRIERRFRSEK